LGSYYLFCVFQDLLLARRYRDNASARKADAVMPANDAMGRNWAAAPDGNFAARAGAAACPPRAGSRCAVERWLRAAGRRSGAARAASLFRRAQRPGLPHYPSYDYARGLVGTARQSVAVLVSGVHLIPPSFCCGCGRCMVAAADKRQPWQMVDMVAISASDNKRCMLGVLFADGMAITT